MTSEPILLSGNAHPVLASMVAAQLGIAVSPCGIEWSADGELALRLRESVRGHPVFILQPVSPPAAEHLIEVIAIADVCRRAAAERLVAVIPYFALESIGAPMLAAAGVSKTIRIGPFDAIPHIGAALQGILPLDVVVVAAGCAALPLAARYAFFLGAPVIALDRRGRPAVDVEGRACVIVDHAICTANSIISAVDGLLSAGAAPDVTVVATHGVFSEGAREKLDLIGEISRVVVTDSLPRPETAWMKLRVVSVAPLIAAAIAAVRANEPRRMQSMEEPCIATSLT